MLRNAIATKIGDANQCVTESLVWYIELMLCFIWLCNRPLGNDFFLGGMGEIKFSEKNVKLFRSVNPLDLEYFKFNQTVILCDI